MSLNRSRVPWPGPARLTLVLLAVIPAALSYPWPTIRDRWVLGVAVAVVILLFGWWRGLPFTSMVRRRLAMLRGPRTEPVGRATAVLRLAPLAGGADIAPVPLLASYLDRYGVRADNIKITSCDVAGAEQRETWVGLTLSVADNLAALQARSSSIPLRETVEVATRRLVDQLRESGWDAVLVQPEQLPEPVAPGARETWRAVTDDSDYVAAYRIPVDGQLSETLREVWAQQAAEIWTTVQIAGSAGEPTIAAACAFRTAARPAGAPPLSGLVPQRGIQRSVLGAMRPDSTDRLDGQAELTPAELAALRWPTGRRPGVKPARKGRHAVA